MTALVKAFVRDERGATAIEYGLIVALIAVTIITALQLVANGAIAKWTTVSDSVDASM